METLYDNTTRRICQKHNHCLIMCFYKVFLPIVMIYIYIQLQVPTNVQYYYNDRQIIVVIHCILVLFPKARNYFFAIKSVKEI